MITVSLIAMFLSFPDTSYEKNLKSGEQAIFFISNGETEKGNDYFTLLNTAVNIFTHTWSLSVEVQFYLIIPIIYIVITNYVYHDIKILSFMCLALVSYIYSEFFCTKIEAFNSTFARIWQFMAGMIVCCMREREAETTRKETIVKYIVLTLMVWILIHPRELPVEVLRPFFTLSTAALIFFSSGDSILSFPVLTYIGDISYSLYLIHWPLYSYWKLELSDGLSSNRELLIIFLVSVGLSVISYEFFEKWYLTLPNVYVLALCISLFSSSIFLLEYNRVVDYLNDPAVGARLDGLKENQVLSFEEVSKIHRKWSLNDYRLLYAPTCSYDGDGPLGWCRHTGLENNNGKLKLMVIGNSWAANHARIFYDECGKKASSIVQFSKAGCDPLEAHKYTADICIRELPVFVDLVEKEKPDYLFLLSRMIDIGEPLPPNITDFDDDPIFQSMRRQTKRIIKHVKKKMFILNAIPDIDGKKIDEITGRIQNNEDLVKFDKSMITNNAILARRRYQKLISECPSCEIIDYEPIFYNNTTGSWRFYDVKNSGLSYLTSERHLSFHGLELVRHVYTDICNKL
ncbi:unnamed protein product [Caenorhabditis brenneri]